MSGNVVNVPLAHPDDCVCERCHEELFADYAREQEELDNKIKVMADICISRLSPEQLDLMVRRDPENHEDVREAFDEMVALFRGPTSNMTGMQRAAFELILEGSNQEPNMNMQMVLLYAKRRAFEKMERNLLRATGYSEGAMGYSKDLPIWQRIG